MTTTFSADARIAPLAPAASMPPRTEPARDELLALVLDQIDYGFVLLDADLAIVHANGAARARLREPSALLVEGGMLRARSRTDRTLLDAAMTGAQVRGLRRFLALGSGESRLLLTVVPLEASEAEGERWVLIGMPRQEICQDLSAHGFARDNGLTDAEARVFGALCRGRKPSNIASDGGVAISTVRSQIASIRRKTQAASIGDLMQRAAQLPPMVCALRC